MLESMGEDAQGMQMAVLTAAVAARLNAVGRVTPVEYKGCWVYTPCFG
jgi:hypothetical protein